MATGKLKTAMKKVESSREDKARDKKMGVKEGSPRDRATDMAQAKRMMGKSAKTKKK